MGCRRGTVNGFACHHYPLATIVIPLSAGRIWTLLGILRGTPWEISRGSPWVPLGFPQGYHRGYPPGYPPGVPPGIHPGYPLRYPGWSNWANITTLVSRARTPRHSAIWLHTSSHRDTPPKHPLCTPDIRLPAWRRACRNIHIAAGCCTISDF
jgi:hypothetical protein